MEKFEERISIVVENQGQKLFAIMHLPLCAADRQVPAVLFCHGLAGHKVGSHRGYVDLASRLSRQGMAALRFDYRGCGDSEGVFHNITPSHHFSDACLFFDYLHMHPQIDSERLGIFGRSFGGAVALKTAAECNIFKSIALWCPFFDSEQWREQWQLAQSCFMDENKQKELLQINSQEVGLPFMKEFFSFDVSSSLNKLAHLPLLHIHGELDNCVDLQHSEKYAALRATAVGINKFIKLPNTGHDFSHIAERLLAIEETCLWFEHTL